MCDAKFDPRWAVGAGGGVGANEEAGTTEKSEKQNIVVEDIPKEKQEEEKAGIEKEGQEVAGEPETPITHNETEGKPLLLLQVYSLQFHQIRETGNVGHVGANTVVGSLSLPSTDQAAYNAEFIYSRPSSIAASSRINFPRSIPFIQTHRFGVATSAFLLDVVENEFMFQPIRLHLCPPPQNQS